MIKLSIVDGYLKFNDVRSRASVCQEFQNWFSNHSPRGGDFKAVYNNIECPEWLCYFLHSWDLFGEGRLGWIFDHAFGAPGLNWRNPTTDKPACDLIRKAMPYQLVLALMEDHGFDFAGGDQ